MRVAAYVRVSRERVEMISPQIQRDEIERYCERQSWTIARVYEDLDISGRKFEERPALQSLLADVDAYGAVVVYRLDRFTREPRHYYPMVYTLQEAGVELHDASEGKYNPGPELEFLRGIKVLLGWQESKTLGVRLKDMHARLAREGRWHGGPILYGFRRNEDGIEPDPARVEIISDLHERYQAGWGLQRLCRHLNDSGVKGSKGGKWEVRQMKSVLFSPTLVGATLHPDTHDLVFGGNIIPLLPLDVYERTLRVRDVRTREKRPGRRGQRLLDPRRVRCGTCGSWCHVHYAKNREPWYRCRGKVTGGCERGVHVKVSALEEYVARKILERLRGTTGRLRTHDAPDLKPLMAEVERIKESMTNLTVMAAEGQITYEEHEAAHTRQKRKLKEAEARLDRAARMAERESRSEAAVRFLEDLSTLTAGEWALMPLDVRREIAGLMVSRVTVNPADTPPRLRVDWTS